MPSFKSPGWFKQFTAFFAVTCTAGCLAILLVAYQVRAATSEASLSNMRAAAVEAVHSRIATTNGHRPQDKPGDNGVKSILFQHAPNSRADSSYELWLADLSPLAQSAISSGRAVIEKETVTDPQTTRTVYVPIDRQSIAIVEIDQAEFQKDQEGIFAASVNSLVVLIAASLCVSFLFTHMGLVIQPFKWISMAQHSKARSWIIVCILFASVVLLFDAVVGYTKISAAGEEAKDALHRMQVASEAKEALREWSDTQDPTRMVLAIGNMKKANEHGLAELGTELLNSGGKDAMLSKVMRDGIDDYSSRTLVILDAANDLVKEENSKQNVRLLVTTAVGGLALLLMGLVKAKEREIEVVTDEASQAKLEYEGLVGSMPIGLIAYSKGKVIYTNGAWGVPAPSDPDSVFDVIEDGDREKFVSMIRAVETNLMPFTGSVAARLDSGLHYFETYGAPIVDKSGNLKRVLVFCIDVSAIVNAREEIKQKHKQVEEKNYQLRAALTQIEGALQTFVEAIVRAVESRDAYTAGHSSRVSQYSRWICQEMGLSEFDIRIVTNGALVHDVGKIGIPDDVLNKPGKLTDEEFAIIQEHPVIGARILGDLGLFRDSLPIVRWHHERLDGKGYPDGLKGDDIPLMVRIVAVADAFDAMTSSRAYRSKMSVEVALEKLAADVADGKMDALAFNCLAKAVEKYGVIPQSEAA